MKVNIHAYVNLPGAKYFNLSQWNYFSTLKKFYFLLP